MSGSEDSPTSRTSDRKRPPTTANVKNTVRSQSRYPKKQIEKSSRARTKASGKSVPGKSGSPKGSASRGSRPKRVSDTRQPELFADDPSLPQDETGRVVASKPQERKQRAVQPVKRLARDQRTHDHRAELIKFFAIMATLTFLASMMILLVIDGEKESARQRAYQESLAMRDKYISYYPSEVRLEIPYGMPAGEVCRLVEMSGVIGEGAAKTLERLLTQSELDTRIRSGPILLPRGMAVEDVLLALTRGYWMHPIVTFYPGQTLEQIDEALAAAGYFAKGMFVTAADQVARDGGLPFTEGYFLPEEYPIDLQVDEQAGAYRLAEQMYERFQHIVATLDIVKAPDTLRDIVIVASMIQRETANEKEMPLIAGIMWKRLEEGIPLGIDATTRYELGDWSDPLKKEDLEALTPYNTRRRKGLPPTGISNPGFEALYAAAHPESSPYYYYLHDAQAGIHFAVTYEEHLTNVRTYL